MFLQFRFKYVGSIGSHIVKTNYLQSIFENQVWKVKFGKQSFGNQVWDLETKCGKQTRLKACSKYMPDYVMSNPTDMRKFWHTETHHKDIEMAEKFHNLRRATANAMDHGVPCGQANYAKGKARKIADDARRLTMTFYGEEMIPFPEFTEDFLKANMQRLQEKFAQVRASTTNSH